MILGIEGSPRKKGNSHKLLEAILAGAGEKGIPTHAAHLRDYRFDPCLGCEACRSAKACVRLKDGMTMLYPHIDMCKGLVLVSPVHNYNVSAWMKAFIDRLYCYYDFEDTRPRAWSSRLAGQGRRAVIAAIAEQADPKDMGFTLDAMRLPLEALGYAVVEEIPVLKIFDRGHVAKHEEIMERAARAGRKLAEAIG